MALGRLALEGSTLCMETNSAERDRRGRDLVEALAGGAVRHHGTVHEDLAQQLREALRSGQLGDRPEDGPGELPPEVAEDLVLDHQACHARQWLDMEIPGLDGHTPRQAATDPGLAPRLADMIRDIEGHYHHALRHDQPAYDPSWMWAERGLAGAAGMEHPPRLAHERWAESVPGLGELCAGSPGEPGSARASTTAPA